MAKTLLFRTVLRKLMGNTTKLIFSQSAQWFSQNISFFNLLSDLFSIIAKKNQSNKDQYRPCSNSPCFRILLCTHYGCCNVFQRIFGKSKEMGIL